MSHEDRLPPDWKLAIREYTASYFSKIGTALGIANVAVLIGGLYFLVDAAAHEAVTQQVSDSGLKESISKTLLDVGDVRGQLKAAEKDILEIEMQYSDVQKKLSAVIEAGQEDVALAANLVAVVSSETDVASTISSLSKKTDDLSWSQLGVMARIQAQSTCTAISDSRGLTGWVTAVPRQCGEGFPSCAVICAGVKQSKDGQLSTASDHSAFSALHIYSNEPRSDTNIAGLKTHSYGQAGINAGGCGPNYCCCLSR